MFEWKVSRHKRTSHVDRSWHAPQWCTKHALCSNTWHVEFITPPWESSRDFAWHVNRKKYSTIHASLGHFDRLLTFSNMTSEHNPLGCPPCFRRWLCGSRALWRLRNWTFPIFASPGCFPWFSKALVWCCRGKNAAESRTAGSLHLASPRLRCRSSSRFQFVWVRDEPMEVRKLQCSCPFASSLCCYRCAVTDLHLHALAVALTARNPLPTIVSTVTVTPLDINAALLLMIPAECCRVLLWLCIQQMFSTCFAHCHFLHPLGCMFQLASVGVFLYRNLIVSVSLVRVMNPSRTCVQHLDRRPGRPAPAQDCLCIFDAATSTNPMVEGSFSKVFLSIAVAKMSLTVLVVGNFPVTKLFDAIMSWIHK